MRQTLYDKIWRDHLVDEAPDGTCLLYVDRHLVHEVDSPGCEERNLNRRAIEDPGERLSNLVRTELVRRVEEQEPDVVVGGQA